MFYFSTKFKDCPTPGFYGERCSSSCPTNSVNGHCNGRGECVGCIIGYQGVHCDKGRCLFVSLSRSFCMTLSSHYLSFSLSVSFCLARPLSVYLSLPVYLYISLSLSVFMYLDLYIHLSVSLSFSLSVTLSFSLCLILSSSVYLWSQCPFLRLYFSQPL